MIPAVQLALSIAAAELAQLRREVTIADIGGFDAVRSQLFDSVRALAYVRASAILEQFTKTALGAVLAEIDTRGVARHTLGLGLHAVMQGPTFDRARDVRGFRMWRARLELLNDVAAATPCTFGLAEFAIDGRTLRADHFEVIWQLFGFAPPSLPRPIHRLALHDLAETRNNLAHGRELPAAVARAKPTAEVLRMVSFVEEIVEHLALTTASYITNTGYAR